LPWVEPTGQVIRVLVRNLSKDDVEGMVAVSGASNQSVPVPLGPYAERVVELTL
jgi:hypothetical protein